jgi:hypothetical protein
VRNINDGLATGIFAIDSSRISHETRATLKKFQLPKLHCCCNQPSMGEMITCDRCLNWYHSSCVKVTDGDRRASAQWFGPCCINRLKEIHQSIQLTLPARQVIKAVHYFSLLR